MTKNRQNLEPSADKSAATGREVAKTIRTISVAGASLVVLLAVTTGAETYPNSPFGRFANRLGGAISDFILRQVAPPPAPLTVTVTTNKLKHASTSFK